MRPVDHVTPRLGLRENLPQFVLLVAVNALVGGMVGQERTVVPLLAEAEFGLASYSAMLTFIVAFGLTKAVVNYFAGTLADRFGRKPVLVAGWLAALPVPLLLMWAPTWEWVVIANILLGLNQGLTWSLTVIMKIDLVGPHRRGLAMGLNEAAGYGAVALAAWVTGAAATEFGLRPAPFLLGVAVGALGLGLSAVAVRETAGHVAEESRTHVRRDASLDAAVPARRVFALATWREPALSSASQAGLVNNLNEGAAWGLFPVLFVAGGLSTGRVGLLIAIAPAVWAIGQLVTGAVSDRIGRKWLIAAGQWTEAAGLVTIALGDGVAVWAAGSALFGAGTALAYPTLLAAVGDVAHPAWRGAAVGVYRFWRDIGFAVGAVLAGVLADAFGVATAIVVVAAVTAASGLDVAGRMYETRPPHARSGA
ncbi:Predicted arabinose efflux permease, MFS family [Haloechinothrix alba]|uniref:Predicted arabinose efflux permease, MFS family n=1 Tax=Haloechinothrix alba TaxID=664784 RepID=A0A238YTD9_9PSEU|nr:MFS transporter [Haloechinothrix alba]SNR74397.1 Predicted arabinose efflux permease, MFS family [Haloechinothrix alba]